MLPPHTRGTLEAQVQGADGLTVYARLVAAWGLWPAYLLVILSLLAAWAWPGRRLAASPSQ
jgi:apolipoprotein N-acyltransferase